MRRGNQRGLTAVEMLAAAAVLAILMSVAIPLKRWDEKRRREAELIAELHMMRDAIDHYNQLVNEGKIQQTDVDQRGYPRSLDELVNGVDVGDPQGGQTHKVRFLHSIPADPFTGDTEWGIRSYQDDWDATSWGGENVYDVYSLSPLKALNGSYYKDW
jgi:general secretion pathway protein G